MKNSELEFKLKEVLPKFSAQFQKNAAQHRIAT